MNTKRIVKILLGNPGLKLLALFISALVWFHAATERDYLTEKKVRLEYVGLSDSLFILNELPENFQVKVSGRGKALINMSLFARPKAVVDLSELDPGRNSMEFDRSVLNIPAGLRVEVEDIQPEEIEFLVDKLSRRTVRVTLQTEGEPKDGFVFREATVETTVYLHGPSQVIRNFPSVSSKPIDLNRKDGDYESEVELVPPDENTWLRPERIGVSVDIEPAFERTFDGVKVNVRAPEGFGIMLSPETLSVRISGLEEIVEGVRKNGISVTLDLTETGEGMHEREPVVEVPEGVKVEEVIPRKITAAVSP
jgi:hypothetical protein